MVGRRQIGRTGLSVTELGPGCATLGGSRIEFRANLALLRHPIPAALWADLRQAGLLHPAAPVPN